MVGVVHQSDNIYSHDTAVCSWNCFVCHASDDSNM